MQKSKIFGSIVLACALLFAAAAPSRAAGCEDKIARHMLGEAMLAAQFVAAAERNGMTPVGINAILKEVADKSAIQEFWITDSSGHAYLTNTGIDFTFSSDAKKQPQASAFWPLSPAPRPSSSRTLASARSTTRSSNMSGSPGSTNRGSCRSGWPRRICASEPRNSPLPVWGEQRKKGRRNASPSTRMNEMRMRSELGRQPQHRAVIELVGVRSD